MKGSWYVALKHEFPSEIPTELHERRDRVRFARWLVVNGLLSDWTAAPSDEAVGQLTHRILAEVA